MERKRRRRWRWKPTPPRHCDSHSTCYGSNAALQVDPVVLKRFESIVSFIFPPCSRILTLYTVYTTGQKLSGRQIVHAGNFYEEGGKKGRGRQGSGADEAAQLLCPSEMKRLSSLKNLFKKHFPCSFCYKVRKAKFSACL